MTRVSGAMFQFEKLAEQRILEAIARGELENLPGQGAPIDLDDDAMVPADMRMAYRILKNAGYVPEEVRLRREIADLEAAVIEPGADPLPPRAFKRLVLLKSRLAARRGRDPAFDLEDAYRRKLLEALASTTRSGETND